MVEYTIGITKDGGQPRRYLRIKSDNPIYVPEPVITFTREQSDKRSVYECIIGDLIRTAKERGFYYDWYELESDLVETRPHAHVCCQAGRTRTERGGRGITLWVTKYRTTAGNGYQPPRQMFGNRAYTAGKNQANKLLQRRL